ncbi:ParB/Srx family N-terminal domain-containing protein [Dankookia sp. P2]|uniref:ParB/Srx family N-terminal domain-containing protein n=1 Tax=Dankookia sp. P2 TaxID=3423955 RepID=UPI003D66DA7F
MNPVRCSPTFPAYKTALVADLVPYARNARTHSEAQVAQIAASIREFGFTNPILVDGERGVIAGHGRLMAARKLGLAEVPTIELSHLTPAQRRAYVLADNKLALNAGWDDDLLWIELGGLRTEGFDLGLTGFDADELGRLLIEATDGLTNPDLVPEPPAEPVSRPGDVWLLGRHRLACGDCTDPATVERVLAGSAAAPDGHRPTLWRRVRPGVAQPRRGQHDTPDRRGRERPQG